LRGYKLSDKILQESEGFSNMIHNLSYVSRYI